MSSPTVYDKIINNMADCNTTNSTYISGSGACTGSQGSFGKFFFAGSTDNAMIKDLTNEIMKKICNQKVYIYSIDENLTKDNIYGESENKIFREPKQTWARIEYETPQGNLNSFGYDIKYTANMYFYSTMLNDQDIKLNSGDVVRVGSDNISSNSTIFYELTQVVSDKPLWGQSDNFITIMARATVARKSILDVLARIQTG